jgi:hypothetical protein
MIRDLGFIKWKDELSWMESMKGTRWDKMVEKENNNFLKAIQTPKELITAKAKDFENAKRTILFSYENIILQRNNNFELEWYYKDDSSKKYTVTDITVYNNKVYIIRDVGDGAENFILECLDGHTIVWSKKHVGPTVIVLNSYCYYLGCTKKLWYNTLKCVNSDSGKEEKIIYEELDERFNLNIVKGDNNCIFLLRENSGKQNLFVIEKDSIIYKNTVLQYYIPIGYNKNKICYLYYENKFWKSSGFKLKKEFSNNIVYASLKNDVLILIENGLQKMYNFNFDLLCTYYGNFIYNSLSENHFERYYIDVTGAGIIEYKYHKPVECITYYGTVKRNIINNVPVITVLPHCKAKGLMCIGYGAYGNRTNMSTMRWKPYIDNGWIISFICVRGSGDVNIEWAESAKTTNKILSFIDFENCIKQLQKKYTISPKNTCIYGRSAGGYLVGAVVSRNPTGNLFKMVYTEVPYVDVLRTTSNKGLPLTTLEYDEFGNPNNGIYEFRKLMEYSPVDSLDYNNPPDLYVLIRTSENDSQVYAYESYKWLTELRGKNKNDMRKILFYTKNKGHFVHDFTNYSQDFFLLNSFRT